VGAIHQMVKALELDKVIDEHVHVFKIRNPYSESDHILSMAFNALAGGECLEDIEVLRQDEAYMDMLGAERIPDPTTAGDFLRRFDSAASIHTLMDSINFVRTRVWKHRRRMLGDRALIDMDGSVTPTLGEKKEGMAMSYKGEWGYHPLLISLGNTQEVMYLQNRAGSVASHENAAVLVDKAIAVCREAGFKEIMLRGDTDFSQTRHLDRWDADGVQFVFGYDAKKNLIAQAEGMPADAWSRLRRSGQVVTSGKEREKRENTKEALVIANEYNNIKLLSEDIAEFDYQPHACSRPYRMVVVRKNLSVEKGETRLFDDVRYFFYITNDSARRSDLILQEAMERCNQENLIAQLKGGVHALHNPAHDLLSNWAYMVIVSLAWTLKAWFALMLPHVEDREAMLKAKFRTFLNAVMLIPAQVVATGRRIVVRLLAYTAHARLLIAAMQAIKPLRFST